MAGRKGALSPLPCVWFCRPSWGDGPGVGLALCCFLVILRGDLLSVLCWFVIVFSSLFGIAIPSLREGGVAGLCAFRAFVQFAHVLFLFLLVPGKVCGLFSYEYPSLFIIVINLIFYGFALMQ